MNFQRKKRIDSYTAIDQIKKEGTLFVADPESAEKLGDSRVIVMQNGDKRDIDDRITIEAVPAYNLVREREPGVKFHPKGWGNGYVATFGDKRVYIAGDTESIPEMASLAPIDVPYILETYYAYYVQSSRVRAPIDVAFIPIDGSYTMSPEEAVGCIKVISPRVVIPYHQRQSDPNVVAELLKGSGIEVRVLPLP